jgi:hypothetical protein
VSHCGTKDGAQERVTFAETLTTTSRSKSKALSVGEALERAENAIVAMFS